MRLIPPVLIAACLALVGCADAAQQKPKTDEDKALYALGVIMTRNFPLQSFELTDKELEMVKAGLVDGAKDKSQLEPEEIEKLIPKLQELQQKRVSASTEKEKSAGAAYLAKAATEPGATKTASGLVYKEVKAGTGATPTASDQVKVHYEGRFTDGKVFDSSIKRGEPVVFPLNGVIPCWTEALQMMKVGGKAQLTCPPELAYGDEGRPPQMRGGATLVFDVELLDIVKEDAAAQPGEPGKADAPAAGAATPAPAGR